MLEYVETVLRCERVEHGYIPVSVYRDLSGFKLYMGDTRLLTMKSGIPQQTILLSGEAQNTFLGALTENYVAQAPANKHYALYYWANQGTAELDFILQKNDKIIPIEVKPGIRIRSKSMNMFVEKYKHAYSIRISAKNVSFENGIKSVSLYAAFCIYLRRKL